MTITGFLVPKCLSLFLCIEYVGGINAFVSRSTKIFQDSGMATSLTTQMSTIMTAVNVIMTFPAIFLIDSFGRKPLLMIGKHHSRHTIFSCVSLSGVAGQAICLSLVPIVSLLGKSTAIAAVVSIIGFIVFFAIAYGPVLWVSVEYPIRNCPIVHPDGRKFTLLFLIAVGLFIRNLPTRSQRCCYWFGKCIELGYWFGSCISQWNV